MKPRLGASKQVRYMQGLMNLLEQVRLDPARFLDQTVLVQSLHSQGKLCRLSLPQFDVLAVSLNTFKRYCQDHVAGGFDAVDRQRRAARDAIEQIRHDGSARRKTQKRLIGELQAEKDQLLLDNLLLTQLLQMAMRQSRYYAQAGGDPQIMALHAKEHRELLDLLSCVRSQTRGPKLEKIVQADKTPPDLAVFHRPGS